MLLLLSYVWRKCANSREIHRFPTSPYQCRHCGSIHLKYDFVKPGNPNGNIGRPYYICVNPYCPNVINSAHHIRGWVTWDDNIGIDPRNPLCKCLRSAREDIAGERSPSPGHHFWTCSTGACDYYRRVPGT